MCLARVGPWGMAPRERRLTGEGLGPEMRRSATAATGCWNQGKGGKVMRKAAASRRTPYSAHPGFGNQAKRGRLKAGLRAILPPRFWDQGKAFLYDPILLTLSAS